MRRPLHPFYQLIWLIVLSLLLIGCTTLPAPALIPIAGSDLIAFVQYGDPRVEVSADIYTMSADGTHLVNVSNLPANYYGLAWSPDGQRLAFVSDRTDKPEIFVMNFDGSNLVELSQGIEDYSYFTDLSWSPDGQSLVTLARFMKPSSTSQQIAIFNATVPGEWRLLAELPSDTGQPIEAQGNNLSILPRSPDGAPQWSPDGKYLAFIGQQNSEHLSPCIVKTLVGPDLFLIKPDGTELVNLTHEDERDVNAFTWSPDGTGLAYLAMKPVGERCQAELKLVNTDGSNPVTIFETYVSGSQIEGNLLKWSPDGTRLLFTLIDTGPPAQHRDLYLIDLKTPKFTSLPDYLSKQMIIDTWLVLGYSTPDWSPDGKWIVYSILGPPINDDIFKLNVTEPGATPVQLTFNTGWMSADTQWRPATESPSGK